MNKNLPSALVAVDVCIFKIIDNALHVYVIDVYSSNELYKGMKCLPGSLIHIDENAEDTLKRVIDERTDMKSKDVYAEQLYTFSDIHRDKRSRAVSVAYMGLMDTGNSTDQSFEKGGFIPVSKIKQIAFDHKEIILCAKERLTTKLHYSNSIKKLIRHDFTFAELQKAYEVIFGRDLDKRNFRKKILALNFIKETGTYKKEGRMRPAMLYTWTTHKVEAFDIFGFGSK